MSLKSLSDLARVDVLALAKILVVGGTAAGNKGHVQFLSHRNF